ncbi:MAG: alpha/beta hydrolase [Dehalococcoidia bacterium]|nr:alpha/beta hydrolase [Dehalococcoidia bacterium]
MITPVRTWLAAGAAVAIVVALLALAFSMRGEDDAATLPMDTLDAGQASEPDVSSPTPTPLPPPSVELADTFVADQGLLFEGEGRVVSPDPGPLTVTVDFGDGATESLKPDPSGRFQFSHSYARGGHHELVVQAVGPTGAAKQAATVDVAPRKVVFIQGMNSESRCPGGDRFLDRAPAWLGEHFATDEALRASLLVEPDDFVYFSYSGEYCDGSNGLSGAAPAYGWGDTCTSIDGGSAARLKELIDGLAPSRVTVVAHSMGGLVAAYLAGSDPGWASERIVSIATVDSPLGGIDRARAEILAFYRMRRDGCGRSSAAMDDLRTGSEVTRVAAGAAKAVPFFTLDGDRKEPGAFGLAEAVPNGRTAIGGAMLHLRVNEAHSGIWTDPPVSHEGGVTKATFVECALLAEPAGCTAPD